MCRESKQRFANSDSTWSRRFSRRQQCLRRWLFSERSRITSDDAEPGCGTAAKSVEHWQSEIAARAVRDRPHHAKPGYVAKRFRELACAGNAIHAIGICLGERLAGESHAGVR